MRQKDAKNLTITLTTNDKHLASNLSTVPPLGGPVQNWLVRWAAPTYKGKGDGNMFYVGMQSAGGGSPTFYTGTTEAITTSSACCSNARAKTSRRCESSTPIIPTGPSSRWNAASS